MSSERCFACRCGVGASVRRAQTPTVTLLTLATKRRLYLHIGRSADVPGQGVTHAGHAAKRRLLWLKVTMWLLVPGRRRPVPGSSAAPAAPRALPARIGATLCVSPVDLTRSRYARTSFSLHCRRTLLAATTGRPAVLLTRSTHMALHTPAEANSRTRYQPVRYDFALKSVSDGRPQHLYASLNYIWN